MLDEKESVFFEELTSYINTKREWYKAFEVFEGFLLILNKDEILTVDERLIFRYQLLLNLMSKNSKDRLQSILKDLSSYDKFEELATKDIPKLLSFKVEQDSVPRRSAIMKEAYDYYM